MRITKSATSRWKIAPRDRKCGSHGFGLTEKVLRDFKWSTVASTFDTHDKSYFSLIRTYTPTHPLIISERGRFIWFYSEMKFKKKKFYFLFFYGFHLWGPIGHFLFNHPLSIIISDYFRFYSGSVIDYPLGLRYVRKLVTTKRQL